MSEYDPADFDPLDSINWFSADNVTFADLVAGTHVFVDANTLIYHFSPHPVLGPAGRQLLADIEN